MKYPITKADIATLRQALEEMDRSEAALYSHYGTALKGTSRSVDLRRATVLRKTIKHLQAERSLRGLS